MAINEPGGNSADPTRGSGRDKITESVSPDLNAAPGALDNEAGQSGTPDPARGGCLKFGWGCLPVLLGVMMIPAGLFF